MTALLTAHPAAPNNGHGPIWLVGMMGSGKSTVGPMLAERLGCSFVDCDAQIERAAGRSIADIFSVEGEAGFRRRESEAVDAAAATDAVVALGGGVIAQPGAAERLSRSGTVVYLRTEPGALLDRIGDPSTRPLLAGLSSDDCLTKLVALLGEREEAYLTATIVLDTDGRAASEVAEALAARLTRGHRDGG